MSASENPGARVWGQRLGQSREATIVWIMEECVVKRFRIAVCLCAAFVLCFALAGCDSQKETYVPASKSPAVASPVIGEDGVLRVGVNTGNPPLAGLGTDKIIGIDVDIAAAIADELGLKLDVVDVGSDPAAALADGTVDIVMGIDISEADGSFWLTGSYLPTAVAIFSSQDGVGVPVPGDGSTFAAQVSSKSAWAVGNEFGLEALNSKATLTDAFVALGAGEVLYAASDAIIGLYAAYSEGISVNIVALMTQPSGYAVGVSNVNAELQALIGEVVAKLSSNGVIDVIEKKWLGTAVDLATVSMIGEAAAPEADVEADVDSDETPDKDADEENSEEA